MKKFLFLLLLNITLASVSAQPGFSGSLRSKVCLNEWWKFYPILDAEGKNHIEPSAIPALSMFKDTILVPGSWTAGGSDAPSANDAKTPWKAWRINDSYGYPLPWDKTNSAWYFREFNMQDISKVSRYFLDFEGILREGYVFVNGKRVGHSVNGIMPNEWEISKFIKAGKNTLHVFVTDYRRDKAGKTFTPTGADQVVAQKGIWQDVYLISRPDVYVEDVTIRTSTRKNQLTIHYTLKNSSTKTRKVKPQFVVKEGNTIHLGFDSNEITLDPGETKSLAIEKAWSSYIPWSPNIPQLYHLQVRLAEQGKITDEHTERFGFREVWTEGHRVMLNGIPVHMFGEWGHKMNFDNFRPEYIRQWYRMLKDCNMNYMRTHTFPHPRIVLELADEMGILVSLESGWFFGNSFALDSAELWKGAEQHIRDIVRTYKNYPSIILYSVGNEVRWSGNQPAIIKNTPGLRKLYEELDPTRIPYHDGDSPLWDERTQHLLSRHYGLECTGEGWWDKSKPLHVGEVGKWHYGQPIDNTIWGNDKMFASFEECHRVIALETADIAELARTNEVTCFFPWNLSSLDNYRPWPQEHKFTWPDPTGPYLKPLRSGPYSSEFTWWEPNGKGYVPGVSFNIMKHAFRPIAVIVREKLSSMFDDSEIKHTVTVVNDGGQNLNATLYIDVKSNNKTVWAKTYPVSIANGYVSKFEISIPPLKMNHETEFIIETSLHNKTEVFDKHTRRIRITPVDVKKQKIVALPLAVLGKGRISGMLVKSGHQLNFISSLKNLNVTKNPVLLVEKNAITLGSTQNKELKEYISKGGKALILEQTQSAMPLVTLSVKPVERCHLAPGAEKILGDLNAADFAFWGTDPYGVNNSDSWVTIRPYFKPSQGNFHMLLYSGYGDFGQGGFYMTPLFEATEGKGMWIGCQLLLSDKAMSHPAAFKVFSQLLKYLAQWNQPLAGTIAPIGKEALRAAEKYKWVKNDNANVIFAKANDLVNYPALTKLREKIKGGAKLIISQTDSACAPELEKLFGITLNTVNLGDIYNLVSEQSDSLISGITNHELYWLDKGQYSPAENKNRVITKWLLHSPQGKVLLSSEQNSCWREFHTLNGRAERTRMPIATYYLWNGPRLHAAGLMTVPYGKGQLIFCQVPVLEESYPKADIFWSTFMSNLGVKSEQSLFEGDCVKAGGQRSQGFPQKLYYIEDPSDGDLQRAQGVSKQSEFRLPNQGMESGFEWKNISAIDGNFTPPGKGKRYLLFYQINAGRPRKELFDKLEGLPDPSQQTLLDIQGSGTIRLTVNGKVFDDALFGAEKLAKLADIDLEMDWNTILLEWTPEADWNLRFDWRNRQSQPEVEFEFK